ncbi:MAG TPA: diguanylate cyclase [Thermoanaerobaculia bacterium]|nr:diguanylate cyclase [Thermoanaerobaculia bacterium]
MEPPPDLFSDPEPENTLGSLRQHFAGRLPERLRELEEAWRNARAAGWREEEAKTAHRLAHSLVGAGATFGFPAVTTTARLLEQRLKPVALGSGPPPDDAAVTELLACIRRAGDLSAPAEASEGPAEPEPAPRLGDPDRKLVFLVEADPEMGRRLAQQLERFWYRVRLLEGMDGIEEEVEREPPSAILMDLAFQRRFARIRRNLRAPVHVLFFSDRGDLEARLEAVRAGGEAYFSQPVDVSSIAERLDLLTGPPDRPYRVLIVESDEELAGECAGALRAAGLEVSLLFDPEGFLETLSTARPDVVLADLELPGCTGAELASVLDQVEGHLGTPVLFLATAGAAEDRLSVLDLGGDDLLIQPIDPLQLIAAVTGRARRGRRLSSLISYDSVTSLLNHGNLKLQLDAELARAVREGASVSFAMIDLDRFKQINDTHGHAAGDRLLRTLALFLKQRLRRSDIVGRYGGDEIGIIFPHTDAATARTVLDALRESFARLRQSYGSAEISATFSGGVAAFPAHATPEGLLEAADQALYVARRAGRNQVQISAPAPTGSCPPAPGSTSAT